MASLTTQLLERLAGGAAMGHQWGIDDVALEEGYLSPVLIIPL
jgi:hypothetical protein